jgi:hypothetical protein
MKSISQIAKECDVEYREVRRIVVIENMTPFYTINKKKLFCKKQEDCIHRILYFSGKAKEITFKSKL